MKVKLSLIDLMLLRDGIANIPGAPTDWYEGRWELHARISPTPEDGALGAGKTVKELSELEVERDITRGDLGKLQTVMQRCEWSPLVGDYAPALKRKLETYADQLEAEELWRRRFPDRPLPGEDDDKNSAGCDASGNNPDAASGAQPQSASGHSGATGVARRPSKRQASR